MKKKIAIITSGWSVAYIKQVLNGVTSITNKNNCDIFFFACYRFIDQRNKINLTGYKIFDLINYEEFDGVIILSDLFDSDEILNKEIQRIKKAKIPAVSIMKQIEGLDYLGVNNSTGFKDLLEHMANVHKYKDYAYIGGPDNDAQANIRLKCFHQFITNHNFTLKDNRYFINGNYTSAFGTKIAKEILSDKNNLPEVVVCVNDYYALAFLAEARAQGINIPKEIKVIGYDNIYYSKTSIPSISTCDGRGYDLGKLAAERIFSQDRAVKNQILDSQAIIRQSCGCSENKTTEDQMDYFFNHFSAIEKAEIFNSQMSHMEDFFSLKDDGKSLIYELQDFFAERHPFEGSNFGIYLKKSFTDSFINGDYSFKEDYDLGDKMNVIVQIKNDKLIPPEQIDTSRIISPSLEDTKPSLYMLFPLISLDAINGYIVCKDSTKFFDSKRAYQWTKIICNNFDNFKQRNLYKQLSEKYLLLSTKDALSGVLNRTGYNTYGEKLYLENKNAGKINTLIFIDINSMKTINDKYGHLQGDMAVKTVAACIQNLIPQSWLAFRYGGDEFLILGSQDELEGKDFTKEFQKLLAKQRKRMKLPYILSASVGILSVQPSDNIDFNKAISLVDQIMYENKQIFHKKKRS